MRNLSFVSIFSFLFFISQSSFAVRSSDNIQVQVTGQITAPICQIFLNQNIRLGHITTKNLNTPGAGSPPIPFKIILTQCSPELSKITVTFNGTPYSEDASFSNILYANEITDGSKDIGLQLFNQDGQPLINLANGISYQLKINRSLTSAELPVAARMYTPHGRPTAGAFKSSVTVNFIYQ